MYIKTGLLFLLAYLIVSCESPVDNKEPAIKTGKVTFFNESSYNVKVHRDSFSGPVLAEVSSIGSRTKTVDVRISDSQGFGTTFSIEYLYQINDAFDSDNGEVIASGLDFNVQINRVIEEGKSYTIQIPQPQNLEFRTAFIKLLNSSNLPIELRDYGRILRLNNGNLSIVPYRTGVYKLEGIPVDGEILEGYHVVATLESTPVPEFTVRNGNIYSFTYDGNAVHDGSLERKPEPKIETIIFR
jgi:hypothetical protein